MLTIVPKRLYVILYHVVVSGPILIHGPSVTTHASTVISTGFHELNIVIDAAGVQMEKMILMALTWTTRVVVFIPIDNMDFVINWETDQIAALNHVKIGTHGGLYLFYFLTKNLILYSECQLDCREMDYVNFQCVDRSNEERNRDRGCCQKILTNDLSGDTAEFRPVDQDDAFCPPEQLHEVGTCEQPWCCQYSEWDNWDECTTADGQVLE